VCTGEKKFENGDDVILVSDETAGEATDALKEPVVAGGTKGWPPNLTLFGRERES
jgi:hypothetical protein